MPRAPITQCDILMATNKGETMFTFRAISQDNELIIVERETRQAASNIREYYIRKGYQVSMVWKV
jgi:phosphopantetheine adenylyltransferase